MRLTDVDQIVRRIVDATSTLNARAITYLVTYPVILNRARQLHYDDVEDLHQLALLVYAWMPRVMEIAPNHAAGALAALRHARSIDDFNQCDRSLLADLGKFLSPTFVGASKILHFANPSVFPIWDSRVERFWRRLELGSIPNNKLDRYLKFGADVQTMRREPGFGKFFAEFSLAFRRRLELLSIRPYEVSEIRAIELCAFEHEVSS